MVKNFSVEGDHIFRTDYIIIYSIVVVKSVEIVSRKIRYFKREKKIDRLQLFLMMRLEVKFKKCSTDSRLRFIRKYSSSIPC